MNTGKLQFWYMFSGIPNEIWPSFSKCLSVLSMCMNICKFSECYNLMKEGEIKNFFLFFFLLAVLVQEMPVLGSLNFRNSCILASMIWIELHTWGVYSVSLYLFSQYLLAILLKALFRNLWNGVAPNLMHIKCLMNNFLRIGKNRI